jgi:hypothetical protein
MVKLDDASKTVIKERIVTFRIIVNKYHDNGDSILITIISGSKAMKKVILDRDDPLVGDHEEALFSGTIKIVKSACKKKEIELWKENFDVGNGKVDLEQ